MATLTVHYCHQKYAFARGFSGRRTVARRAYYSSYQLQFHTIAFHIAPQHASCLLDPTGTVTELKARDYLEEVILMGAVDASK